MAAPRTTTMNRAWLASRGLLPRVKREIAVDQAIAAIRLDEAGKAAAREDAATRWSDAETRLRLERGGMRLSDVEALCERERRIRLFQESRWQAALPAYFLKRKSELDQAIYWLLRTTDRLLARELYFRIREGEEDFASVAAAHSLGPEAETCGLLGPAPLESLAPALAKLLLESKPGKLRPPVQIGEWTVIVRLQKILPCQLDAAMEQRLYDELFNEWLEAQQ